MPQKRRNTFANPNISCSVLLLRTEHICNVGLVIYLYCFNVSIRVVNIILEWLNIISRHYCNLQHPDDGNAPMMNSYRFTVLLIICLVIVGDLLVQSAGADLVPIYQFNRYSYKKKQKNVSIKHPYHTSKITQFNRLVFWEITRL